ncbi:unnamed protein product [Rhizophagus irregularis]|nr:unnamed protein product [Rhizophagus irregularis]
MYEPKSDRSSNDLCYKNEFFRENDVSRLEKISFQIADDDKHEKREDPKVCIQGVSSQWNGNKMAMSMTLYEHSTSIAMSRMRNMIIALIGGR